MSQPRKIFKALHFQRQEKKCSEHCCVPLCSASSKFNGLLSFHGFPADSELRKRWLINIRRDNFNATPYSKVCSRHFDKDSIIEPASLGSRRRLNKGAAPTLFEWNGYTAKTPRRSVWERTEQPTEPVPHEEEEQINTAKDHDCCSVPEPSALDLSASAAEDLSEEVEELREELRKLRIQREFGLQRFAGSDSDIRFCTSYNHLMAFWSLIEPCIYKMVRVSRANQPPRGMKK